jgi:hypothetical protein
LFSNETSLAIIEYNFELVFTHFNISGLKFQGEGVVSILTESDFFDILFTEANFELIQIGIFSHRRSIGEIQPFCDRLCLDLLFEKRGKVQLGLFDNSD